MELILDTHQPTHLELYRKWVKSKTRNIPCYLRDISCRASSDLWTVANATCPYIWRGTPLLPPSDIRPSVCVLVHEYSAQRLFQYQAHGDGEVPLA